MVRRSAFAIVFILFIQANFAAAEIGGAVSSDLASRFQRSMVRLQGERIPNCLGVLIGESAFLSSARCATANRVTFYDGTEAVIDFSVAHPNFSIPGVPYNAQSQSDAINDIALFHFVGSRPGGAVAFGWFLEGVELFPVSTNDGGSFPFLLNGGPSSRFFKDVDARKVLEYYPLSGATSITSWGIFGAPVFGVNAEGTGGGLIAITGRPALSRRPNGSTEIVDFALIGTPIIEYQNWISEWMDAFLLFDESFYLRRYPQVATLINRGIHPSALQHYFTVGERQDLVPSAFFDPGYTPQAGQNYRIRQENNRVREAAGLSKFRYWLKYGFFEGVAGSPNFDLLYYLAKNQDVREICEQKARASCGLSHFLSAGILENRIPSARLETFNEQNYLAGNAAAAQQLRQGRVPSVMYYLIHLGLASTLGF